MNYFDNPKHAIRKCMFTLLLPKTKKPFIDNWNLKPLTSKDILSFSPLPGRYNVGIMLGAVSDSRVDVDLDGPYTAAAADVLLDDTGMMFGRPSAPRSHRIYKVVGSTETLQIRHRDTNAMIVEIRGDGAQTMGPLSIHPDTGEQVRFEDGKEDEPALIDREALNEAVRLVAAVSVLAEHWEGGRHDLTLWFAGLCACHGVSVSTRRVASLEVV